MDGIFAEIQIRYAKPVCPALYPQRGAGPHAQGPMIMLEGSGYIRSSQTGRNRIGMDRDCRHPDLTRRSILRIHGLRHQHKSTSCSADRNPRRLCHLYSDLAVTSPDLALDLC
jgi:hypothetical protein